MELAKAVSRILVVTPNIVVGEDLKDMLSEHAEAGVDVHRSLGDAWGQGYVLALFDISTADVLRDARVRDLHKSGTRVVLLDSGLSGGSLEGTGLIALSQPFTTDDIVNLLRRLGIGHG